MPAPHLPLFHPRLIKERLAQHSFPADLGERHARLLDWVTALRSGALDGAKEVELHGQFLEQVFSSVLGYRGRVQSGGASWELNPEKTVSASGKSADGAIGFFSQDSEVVFAPIELKGARQSLDHAGSRALTPVQQAWEYAQYSPASRFVIVSNYRETRLYAKALTPDEYELFLLDDLANLDAFRRFYFLLARENLLPAGPLSRSPVDALLLASSKVEEQITTALYGEYRGLRSRLYDHLGKVHSNLPRRELLGHTQKILDRILFIAFAEKRGLLPEDTLQHAITHRDRYQPRPAWENLVAVFRFIDQGSAFDPKIPAYNGGLFRPDPELDELEVADDICAEFLRFAQHDFREEISVEVIGHLFEQSITDLEELRAEADGESEGAKAGKRKAEGVYYTPSFITRFIVEETLGRTLQQRWEAILVRVQPDAAPRKGGNAARWIEAWEAYREELKGLRVLDLACGSGAFLIAAFDRLAREYERVNASLADLRGGQITLFDLTRTILNGNLFGVDINEESVEITKLSLWLKTAQYGQRLADLGRNIKWGNSVVDDVMVDARSFDWNTGLPSAALLEPASTPEEEAIDARWRARFDVVVGNPPYVRQERLAAWKPHWQQRFRSYHGVADLYVYFFERGLQVLKEGGRLGFVVANKWLRAGYADLLRGLLAKETRLETFVDFGHAPIFPDADAFPCVIALSRGPAPEDWWFDMTQFPRAALGETAIADYVKANRYSVPQNRLGSAGWSLEPIETEALLDKIRHAGVPLVEYAGVKPYRGVVTGFNEAFLIDTKTRDRLVREDPGSAAILKKYLRGEDIARWSPEWDGQWMIFARRGIDIERFPAIKAHLEGFRAGLTPRPIGWKPTPEQREWPGRKPGSYKWYEIQDSVDYWELFDAPKIFYSDITWRSEFCIDDSGLFTNNTAYILPSADRWLCALLNSPLFWAYSWRRAQHAKDEALRLFGEFMETLPIARPSPAARDLAETLVPKLIASKQADQSGRRQLCDSLRLQFAVESPGQKLSDPAALDADGFAREVVARRPRAGKKLKASEVSALGELYEEIVAPMQARQASALLLERQLAQTVNTAYGLTKEEVALLWDFAPPRMPVGR